jgi:predicted RNase H-like HicB family nuclease
MKYAVIFAKEDTDYGAYVPDLPGYVAIGKTLDEVQQLIREAIAFHVKGPQEEGLPVPPPTSLCEYVELHEGPA